MRYDFLYNDTISAEEISCKSTDLLFSQWLIVQFHKTRNYFRHFKNYFAIVNSSLLSCKVTDSGFNKSVTDPIPHVRKCALNIRLFSAHDINHEMNIFFIINCHTWVSLILQTYN